MSTAYLTEIEAHCASVHAANVEAGWWSDLTTGESIIATRNRPEILMLCVSELAEAAYGCDNLTLMDDKLPNRPTFYVELADTAIRLMDLIGADVGPETLAKHAKVEHMQDMAFRLFAASEGERLMAVVCFLSAAMEGFRKADLEAYHFGLVGALLAVFAIAKLHEVDLPEIIDEKRAYNAQRADHKPENRRAAGGKAF